MTPERWRQVGELFAAAVRVDPVGRESWLRAASGGDDALRAEVSRLLAQDERADRDGLLTPPRTIGRAAAATSSWHPRAEVRPPPRAAAGSNPVDDTKGFTPREAIASRTARPSVCEPPAVVRTRLRELPIIYILMLGIATFWRHAVLASQDVTLYQVDGAIILGLTGILAVLWSRRTISLTVLKALELAMIGVMASRLAFVQYRLMLTYSLGDDRMMAQLTMKNVVLLTAILIIVYGLYVPKSWRRAALVVGPLALLPFLNLTILALRYPVAMEWLWKGWMLSDTPRIRLFVFDAMILLMLAVGATFGPVSLAAAARGGGDGRGLPGRAPAPQAAVRRQADPIRRGDGSARAGTLRARGPAHGHALASEHRRDL
jgi:serine/threonine-protein kinase